MLLTDLFHQLSLLVGLPAVVLASVGAAALVIVRDWRLALFGYALLSVMLALLLGQVLPTEWALLQMIVGGLNAVMLYLSASQLRGQPTARLAWEARWPQMASLSSFRTLTVAVAAIAFLTVRQGITLPVIDRGLQDAVLWLGIVGLLGLALHEEPLHAGLALLTLLGGFNLFLFSLTQQRLLVALTGGGQLLLGLAISYLVISRGLAVPPALDERAVSRGEG
jgi:hypothetical protein